MKSFWISALFCWLPIEGMAATSFSTSRPGIEAAQGTFRQGDRTVSFTLVRCDPKKVGIRVIDTLHELGHGGNLNSFSLRVLSRSGPLLAANAGSTESYSVPIPTGLLIVKGRVISPVSRQATDPGFLCISGARISIVKLSNLDTHDCAYAVQRGPFFLPGPRPASTDSHRRTIFALDALGRLLVLVTANRATLGSIYDFLGSSSDLAITSAINMDGDASSGMIFSPELGLTPNEIGNVDALIASAIAIYPSIQ